MAKMGCTRQGLLLSKVLTLFAIVSLIGYGFLRSSVTSAGERDVITYVRIRPNQNDYHDQEGDSHSVDSGLGGEAAIDGTISQNAADGEVEEPNLSKELSPHHHMFQKLDDDQAILVYSAHYDAYDQLVKLVGFGHVNTISDSLRDYKCVVETDGSPSEMNELAVHFRISTFFPWPGQVYDSFIYQCGRSSNPPRRVKILSSKQPKMELVFHIEPQPEPLSSGTGNFGICVAPLVKGFDDIEALKSFIATNSMFGGEHFQFYISEASTAVQEFLDRLVQVTAYRWPLGRLSSQTHAFGQKAAYAHCLYSNKYSYKYLAFIDIDEIIVPRTAESWDSMMTIIKQSDKAIGAAVFQSQIFPLDYPSETVTDSYPLTGLTHRRSAGVYPLYHWSKVIVESARIDVTDIHQTRQLYPGFHSVNVSKDTALIHHYRQLDANEDNLSKDNTLLKFKDKLIQHYEKLFA